MEWFIFAAAGWAIVTLWRKVERLEHDVELLLARARQPLPKAASDAEAAQAAPVEQRKPATIIRTPSAVPPVGPDPQAWPASPAPVAAPAPSDRGKGWAVPSFSFDFEQLFGRMLPIWAGGITLAVAGFFLVRYAIDVGLLSPAVRVALGFAFGLALIAGAEGAYRFEERVRDPRVPQALAGAGLATLYASVFLAGTLYGLIGPGTAFVGLALVTGAALAASFRFGVPCAVLALVGGFAAPVLVNSQEANLPMLAIYLALVAGGLGYAARRSGPGLENGGWLGIAGIVGGLGWGGLMLATGPVDSGDVAALGLYLVVLGAVLPAFVLPEMRAARLVRLVAGGFAALQMAALLESSGYEALSWGLYALLGAALAVLGWRERGLREASAVAGGVAAWMMGFWYAPDPALFAAVGAAIAAIFAGVPLVHVWRGDARGADIAALAVIPAAAILASYWHFVPGLEASVLPVALAGLALAAMPALGAWRIGDASPRWHAALLEASAVFTAYAGVAQIVPSQWLAWLAGLAAVALAFGLPDRRGAARTALVIALIWAAWPFGHWLLAALATLGSDPGYVGSYPALADCARYLLPGAVATAAMLWRGDADRTRLPRAVAWGGAGLLLLSPLHVLFKQAFAIEDRAQFVALGLAERSVWEALLLALALGAAQLRGRFARIEQVGLALAAAGFAHFAWYTGLLHNPLWTDQAVGTTPLANLVLVAYAIGAAALLTMRKLAPVSMAGSPVYRIGIDAALMVLIAMFALSELRQVYAGSLLTGTPVGQAEDLLRSLAGIVLAGTFLLWGARSDSRAWRIGSLVLTILAVGKVFLYDAAGLEGLARIASFLALGFSLIGIGWFYSRQLKPALSSGVGTVPSPGSGGSNAPS